VNPAINPGFTGNCAPGCTVTSCSCTQSGFYWASTTDQDFPANAWYVYFYVGYVCLGNKSDTGYVRAGRGGS
jgi:hypothetical protein